MSHRWSALKKCAGFSSPELPRATRSYRRLSASRARRRGLPAAALALSALVLTGIGSSLAAAMETAIIVPSSQRPKSSAATAAVSSQEDSSLRWEVPRPPLAISQDGHRQSQSTVPSNSWTTSDFQQQHPVGASADETTSAIRMREPNSPFRETDLMAAMRAACVPVFDKPPSVRADAHDAIAGQKDRPADSIRVPASFPPVDSTFTITPHALPSNPQRQ